MKNFGACLALALVSLKYNKVAGKRDFKCPEPNGLFADPQNCIKYYQCFKNGPAINICPIKNGQQLLFDPVHLWCNWPSRVNCGSRPICDVQDENCNNKPTLPPATTEAPSICNKLGLCSHEGALAPQESCSQQFCECSDGRWHEISCEGSLVFDPSLDKCNLPDKVPDCNLPTPPPKFECPKPNGLFADPQNCIKYYQCYKNGPAINICPIKNGQQLLFDPVHLWCNWPSKVNCGTRPICDANDENCNTESTLPPSSTSTLTSTRPPNQCNKLGACSHDGALAQQEQCGHCFCECANGSWHQICCQPNLVFDPRLNQCNYPYSVPECH